MKKSAWLILLGVVVILGVWLAGSYNGFIASKANVDGQWAQVETQYQRRFDLIPNLVATTKGNAKFEQETFTGIAQARSGWAQAKDTGNRDQQIDAAEQFDAAFTPALSRIMLTFEAYPELKANASFASLMTELTGTENRIAVARKDYNESVKSYNVRVQSFPGSLLAGIFGFRQEKFFQSAAGSETAPTVNFNN